MTVNVKLKVSDSIEYLKTLPDESIDSCITDPPYGLTSKPPKVDEVLRCWLDNKPYLCKKKGFMGNSWDSLVPGPELWKEVYRVLKPGAFMSAFFSPKTVDLGGMAIRLAGFEIRDQIAWLRKGGMPHSTNLALAVDKKLGVIGNRGAGFSVVGNGTQASMEGKAGSVGAYDPQNTPGSKYSHMGTALKPSQEPIIIARKPLKGTLCDNVTKYETGGMDVVNTRFGSDKSTVNGHVGGPKPFGDSVGVSYKSKVVTGKWPGNAILGDDYEEGWLNGSGDLAKFFLVAKTTKKEKLYGTENLTPGRAGLTNPHPSVKPVELMRLLVKLLAPMPHHVVLDPFLGSGSTGIASILEERDFIGVDLCSEYVDIARARIEAWAVNYGVLLSLN